MNRKPLPDAAAIKAEILDKYPTKVAKKRGKAMVVNDPAEVPAVQANVRTVPGIITQRGCCYAGCKGVVLGPTRDIINITHGPIGCGFYSWLTRRNQTNPGEVGPDGENYMTLANDAAAAYQTALRALGDGAVRDIRIVEGLE